MTLPVARSRKVVWYITWFSTGRDSACSDIQISDQFAQQSASINVDRHSLTCDLAVFQTVVLLSHAPAPSSAALKSP
jgi:hypothetical protein